MQRTPAVVLTHRLPGGCSGLQPSAHLAARSYEEMSHISKQQMLPSCTPTLPSGPRSGHSIFSCRHAERNKFDGWQLAAH